MKAAGHHVVVMSPASGLLLVAAVVEQDIEVMHMLPPAEAEVACNSCLVASNRSHNYRDSSSLCCCCYFDLEESEAGVYGPRAILVSWVAGSWAAASPMDSAFAVSMVVVHRSVQRTSAGSSDD